jgi:bloom syndrome protein
MGSNSATDIRYETDLTLSLQIDRDLSSGHPRARLLYITPESLFTQWFMKSLRKVVENRELKRLVVDEVS